MKTYVNLLSVLSCVAMSASVMASGADSSAYQGALFNGDSTRFADAIHSGGPRKVSLGISVQQQNRALKSDFGGATDTKINHLLATVGYDVTKWLTLYGGAGEADVDSGNGKQGSNAEWLFGGTVRALDFMVLEPWNDIDNYWVGVDVNSFYRNVRLKDNWGGSGKNLSELFASVTMSFYSRPEKPGIWDRLGFYFGPAISTLSMSDRNEDQMFGLIGGLQLNPNPNMGFKLEVQKFEGVGLGASFNFHF